MVSTDYVVNHDRRGFFTSPMGIVFMVDIGTDTIYIAGVAFSLQEVVGVSDTDTGIPSIRNMRDCDFDVYVDRFLLNHGPEFSYCSEVDDTEQHERNCYYQGDLARCRAVDCEYYRITPNRERVPVTRLPKEAAAALRSKELLDGFESLCREVVGQQAEWVSRGYTPVALMVSKGFFDKLTEMHEYRKHHSASVFDRVIASVAGTTKLYGLDIVKSDHCVDGVNDVVVVASLVEGYSKLPRRIKVRRG